MLIYLCFQQVVDKEWDKYRVAFVITGKPHYVEEDDKTINTKVRQAIAPIILLSLLCPSLGIPRHFYPWGPATATTQQSTLDRTGAHQQGEQEVKI